MAYNLTADVTYKENCEFNESKSTCIYTIEEQDTTCSMSISPESITIGKTCTITVTVESNSQPVKIGTVKVLDENKTIIDDICKVNNDGKVIIKYQPTSVGQHELIAKYQNVKNDNTQIFNKSTSNTATLTVNPIGTQIAFTHVDDIVTDVKKEATLEAKVVLSEDTETPVPYGRVTFLYYKENYNPDDTNANRIERVIGNPVFVDEEGIATLKYIPEQNFDNLETKYYENIHAIYNYDNEKYGAPWNFYGKSAPAITKVFINKDGIIDIDVLNQQNISLTPLADKYPWACAKETDKLYLSATLYDEKDNAINQKGSELYIHIQGTRIVPKNSTYTYIESDDEYIRENFDFVKIEIPPIQTTFDESKDCFIVEDLNEMLTPGYYTIYGSFEKNKIEIDGIEEYVQSVNKSMVYYLEIEYEKASDLRITLPETYYPELNEPFNIEGTIVSEYASQFVGAPCYYYIPKLDKTFEGTVYKDGEQIKIKLNENITISSPGTYKVYVKMGGLYKNLQIPTTYSNQMTIKCTTDIKPTLTILRTTDYPGTLRYRLNVTDIVEDIIQANIYNYTDENDKGEPNVQYFDDTVQSFTHTISDLPVGDYTLEAEIIFKDEIKKLTETYTISKSLINYEIAQETKKVLANPNQDVLLLMSCSGGNFSDIDKEKITIEVDGAEVSKGEMEYLNDKQNCRIRFKSSTAEKGKHTVVLLYNDEDDKFYSNNDEVTFETYMVTPKYIVALDEKDENNPKYKITIENHYGAERIPIDVRLDNSVECTVITDTDGTATVEYNKHNEDELNMETWCSFESIDLTINPEAEYGDDIQNILSAQKELYGDKWFGYYEACTKQYYIGR